MNNLETVTLFVRNLEESITFYESAFEVESVFEDEVSWVFKLGSLMINLLQLTEAAELVEPLLPDGASAGPRMLFTIRVENVDATCDELQQKGIPLLNGPMDRPWHRRTAAFADPDSYVWEIAQEI